MKSSRSINQKYITPSRLGGTNRIINLGDKYIHHPQMAQLWQETEAIVKPYL